MRIRIIYVFNFYMYIYKNMYIYKKNLISKINNIECKNTLNTIFLILKANKIKYIQNLNDIKIDFNQDISLDLLKYIDNITSIHKIDICKNYEKKKPELSYDINEYIINNQPLNLKLNEYNQHPLPKKREVNSLIYKNIMKIINN